MASLLDFLHGLTKTEVTGPDGQTKFYNPSETDSGKAPGKNALQLLLGEGKQEMAGVQPETDTHNVQLPEQGGPSMSSLPPELQSIFGVQPPANPGAESISEQNGSSPLTITKPTLRQASTDAAGLPTANSPRLTTKGKSLIAILNGGLGALAGSGQRTAAGGFEAAMEQPIQRAAQRQQLERGNLENQNLRQTIQYNPFLRALGIQKSQADINKTNADAGKAEAETSAIPSKMELERIQALTAKYKEQNGILYDVTTGKPLTPNSTGLIETPSDIATAMHVKPGTMLPAKQITEARNAAYGHLAGADPVVVAQLGQPPTNDPVALAKWGKQAEAIKTRMSAAPRLEMTLARPVQVADENSPGNTKYVTAGEAMKTGAAGTQSASLQVAKAAAKSEVPTNIGNQKVAFNTMIDHAELLRKAAKALKNGDNRTLAGLKNAINTEFGVPDVTDFNAIANAYNHEVTTVVAKGHMTDSEVKTGGATMPSNANFETIDRVLNSYKSLAQSKMKNLNKQKDAAVSAAQGKGAASSGEITVIDPAGGVHAFPDQKAADAYKVAVGIK